MTPLGNNRHCRAITPDECTRPRERHLRPARHEANPKQENAMRIKDFVSDVGGLAITAAGAAVGGPIGATAAMVAKKGLEDLAHGDNQDASPVWGSNPPTNQDWPGGLSSNGRDTVDTGRYLVNFNEGDVRVFDKQSNTWIRAWGDPHLHTSDGDKAQFHDNLTIDLPDGAKMTFKTTEPDSRGIALIDSVAIMKGSEAVVVTGISDGESGVRIGNVLNNADSVDAAWADGTVLRAGQQIDDLTFAADGREILGSDPTQRFNEHMLDGKGGESINRPDTFSDAASGANGVDGTGKTDDAEGVSDIPMGGSISAMLMAILQRLEKSMRSRLEAFKEKSELKSQFENKLSKLDNEITATLKGDPPGDVSGLQDQRDALVKQMNDSGLSEGALKSAMMEFQELQNLLAQITTAATNIQKTYHDSSMNIAQNLN
jgi:hypothetical protein